MKITPIKIINMMVRMKTKVGLIQNILMKMNQTVVAVVKIKEDIRVTR
jgi:hypothetical protein